MGTSTSGLLCGWNEIKTQKPCGLRGLCQCLWPVTNGMYPGEEVESHPSPGVSDKGPESVGPVSDEAGRGRTQLLCGSWGQVGGFAKLWKGRGWGTDWRAWSGRSQWSQQWPLCCCGQAAPAWPSECTDQASLSLARGVGGDVGLGA